MSEEVKNYNKVQFGDTVLIDLTGDTVSAQNLLSGIKAHDSSGQTITGTMSNNPTITTSIVEEITEAIFKAEVPSGFQDAKTVEQSIDIVSPTISAEGSVTTGEEGETKILATVTNKITSAGYSPIQETQVEVDITSDIATEEGPLEIAANTTKSLAEVIKYKKGVKVIAIPETMTGESNPLVEQEQTYNPSTGKVFSSFKVKPVYTIISSPTDMKSIFDNPQNYNKRMFKYTGTSQTVGDWSLTQNSLYIIWVNETTNSDEDDPFKEFTEKLTGDFEVTPLAATATNVDVYKEAKRNVIIKKSIEEVDNAENLKNYLNDAANNQKMYLYIGTSKKTADGTMSFIQYALYYRFITDNGTAAVNSFFPGTMRTDSLILTIEPDATEIEKTVTGYLKVKVNAITAGNLGNIKQSQDTIIYDNRPRLQYTIGTENSSNGYITSDDITAWLKQIGEAGTGVITITTDNILKSTQETYHKELTPTTSTQSNINVLDTGTVTLNPIYTDCNTLEDLTTFLSTESNKGKMCRFKGDTVSEWQTETLSKRVYVTDSVGNKYFKDNLYIVTITED